MTIPQSPRAACGPFTAHPSPPLPPPSTTLKESSVSRQLPFKIPRPASLPHNISLYRCLLPSCPLEKPIFQTLHGPTEMPMLAHGMPHHASVSDTPEHSHLHAVLMKQEISLRLLEEQHQGLNDLSGPHCFPRKCIPHPPQCPNCMQMEWKGEMLTLQSVCNLQGTIPHHSLHSSFNGPGDGSIQPLHALPAA